MTQLPFFAYVSQRYDCLEQPLMLLPSISSSSHYSLPSLSPITPFHHFLPSLPSISPSHHFLPSLPSIAPSHDSLPSLPSNIPHSVL